MSDENKITYHKGDDPEFLAAFERARKTFPAFWYQVALDFNRIIPALSMAAAKAEFSDDPNDPDAPVEHMWVGDIRYDGREIRGSLLNDPNELTSVSEGDEVSFPLSRLSDWLCVVMDDVYGGHSIQVTRSRMSPEERASYDEAWGMDFPPPPEVRIPERTPEMENTIATHLRTALDQDPSIVSTVLDDGMTHLHYEAIYGRLPTAKLLVERGANPKAKCDQGWTPADYARAIGWAEIAAFLDGSAR